jgi:anti-sigma regulatory factor (Ser/Thr protein kinase)
MLAGLGEFLELDPELLDDLKTAISEACNNVVLHAYSGDTGPLQMSLSISEDEFDVSVRDEGIGLQRVSSAGNRMGVGLAVISALARRAEFQSEPGGGTEVRMSFGSDGVGARAALLARGTVPATPHPSGLAGDIIVSLAPAELLVQVMGRLVRAVAAGAHFSVDRFPSLHLLTSAISAKAAERDEGGEVSFAIVGHPKHLEIRVGPLPAGSSLDLFGGPIPAGLDGLIERIEASRLPEGELVEVVVVEPRR